VASMFIANKMPMTIDYLIGTGIGLRGSLLMRFLKKPNIVQQKALIQTMALGYKNLCLTGDPSSGFIYVLDSYVLL
jgi:hypothetical protein